MSCFRPLKAFRLASGGVVFSELARHDTVGDVEIACGQCAGCRMRRASDWALRCMHEASLHEANCFLTLTYGRDALPPDGSLCYRDFQLFMKRMRKRMKVPVRFYMCGEYGPVNLRPHYHACIFGVNFSDRVYHSKSAAGYRVYTSGLLDELWTHGMCTVQDLCKETAGYCARYIMKKQLGEGAREAQGPTGLLDSWVDGDGVIRGRVPEFSNQSLKPGIGEGWFRKYHSDVFPHDFCVADGVKGRPPKYYDKLLKRMRVADEDSIEFARQKRAALSVADNTSERRRVREIVFEAKVRNLSREDL